MKRETLQKISAALALFLSLGAASVLSACAAKEETTEKNFSIENGKAVVRWEKVKGATGYRVYAAESYYGSYKVVSEEQKGTTYTGDDVNAYYLVEAVLEDEDAEIGRFSFEGETFGENVRIYAPTDNISRVQKDFSDRYKTSEKGEFSRERFAAFFKAGDYSALSVDVGYYTSVAGLGDTPASVRLGGADVVAAPSLINFWRTAENFEVAGGMTWAVSQGTSLRRVNVRGDLALSAGRETSGGFLADVAVTGKVVSGSQQQFFARNCSLGGWSNSLWNTVFVGTDGHGKTDKWSAQGDNYTVIGKSERVQEKPRLTFDKKAGYRVFVPALSFSESGARRQGAQAGEYLPLDSFYVARSDRDDASSINAALKRGKNLLLTPGVYDLDEPIAAERAGTIVLGMGLATLRPSAKNTTALMTTGNGVSVSGILFDAGASTDTLLTVGKEGEAAQGENPALLADLFFRVGGASAEKTQVRTACAVVNADGALLDNLWLWRADHGFNKDASTNKKAGVGWNVNRCDTGLIVNGDGVTACALFAEHFQGVQTDWRGKDGTTFFYQSEIPYDVPSASGWDAPSYRIGEEATGHRLFGAGVYCNFDEAVVLTDAIRTETDEVALYHLVAVFLANHSSSGIAHVVNGQGAGVYGSFGLSVVERYPA